MSVSDSSPALGVHFLDSDAFTPEGRRLLAAMGVLEVKPPRADVELSNDELIVRRLFPLRHAHPTFRAWLRRALRSAKAAW